MVTFSLFKKKRDFPKPIKKLGQNFIFNLIYLKKIVKHCSIKEGERILEIGSGRGDLTQLLAETECFRVLSLEKDERLFNLLKTKTVFSKKITFFLQDVLKVDWNTFCFLNDLKVPVKVVGNLPYYLANSLLLELLFQSHLFDCFYFLVQKEVAYRWMSKTKEKEYSAISVLIGFLSKTRKLLFVVPNTVFFPRPSVEGALVEILVKKDSLLLTEQIKSFWFFLQNCFRFRRKTLLNNLFSFSRNSDKEIWVCFWQRQGYSVKMRPADFPMENYWNLFIFWKEEFLCKK